MAEKDLLETAKKRFKVAFDAESEQRQREKDDLRFQVPEFQWDEAAKRQRLGFNDAGVPTPARPCLSISKLDQPIQIVLNQERQSKLGVTIQPLSPDADDKVAAIYEGIYRRIERDSQAHLARSWAFDRAVKAGRGAYRVITKWADEAYGYAEDPSDQVICIERILHQESVYFDPAATKPDFSDGEYAFVSSWVPLETFKREFPDADTEFGDEPFDEGEEEPAWIRGEGEGKAILVCEHFYKVHTKDKVQGSNRERDVVSVKWCKLTGKEVLEEQDWNGRYIPLIPVIGQEIQPFDDERRWEGIIRPAKDAQRLYNYAASTAVELAALEPKAPYIGAEGQFEGHEAEWQQANQRNYPYLEYKPKDIDGTPAPPPQRAQVDVGRLGPSMQLLAQADQFIQATTATYDPSLGRTSAREKSGRAIMALQQQGDATNSHYMHNLADISMTYEARVILDLIPAIYDRPGRLARTLSEEGESDTVMLNQAHYTGPDGKPVAVEAGMPPPMPRMAQGGPQGMMPPQPPQVKQYDLRKGIYSVAISIGKTRQSALQEAADEIGQILQAQPNLMPILGPDFFENRAFPGSKKIAENLRKIRDKEMPFLAEPKEGEQPTLEQAMSQVGALKSKMEEMGQMMDQMKQALETKQVEGQTKLQATQMEGAVSLQKAEMEGQTRVAVAQVQADAEYNNKALGAKLDEILAALKMRHESEENELDRQHETKQAVVEAALAPVDLNFKGSADEPLPVEDEI